MPGVYDQDAPERGENLDHHLLPDRARWLRLTLGQRADLLEAVADWAGPAVQRWRNEVGSR
jgi:hypothetical protein